MTFVRKNNLEDVGSHNESDDGDQLPAFSVKPFQALLSDCKDMQKVELRQRWLCHSQPELRKIYLVITTPAGRKVFNPVDASFFFLPLLRCAEDFRM